MPTSPPEIIPEAWRQDVIKVLRSGQDTHIDWTLRARTDWSMFGLSYQAYELLTHTLSTPSLVGRQVLYMDGATEVWEFLCHHPLGIDTPLYAKIGLKEGRLSIKIFSTHIDHSGELLTAIQRLQRRKRK